MRFSFILKLLELLVSCNVFAFGQYEEAVIVEYFLPTKIRNLVSYEDILIYHFEIPEDVSELFFSLMAYESSGMNGMEFFVAKL